MSKVDVRSDRHPHPRIVVPTQYLKERERLIVKNLKLGHRGWVSDRDRSGVLRDHRDKIPKELNERLEQHRQACSYEMAYNKTPHRDQVPRT